MMGLLEGEERQVQAVSVEPASSTIDELLVELEARGIPSGAWLLDIARVRHALQEADSLLRRLEDAIVRNAASSPLEQR
jgi:hypothetical protein